MAAGKPRILPNSLLATKLLKTLAKIRTAYVYLRAVWVCWKGWAISLHWTLVPVSYTHLDVYKRQTDYHTLESGFKAILLNNLDQVFDIYPEDDQKTVYKKIDEKMEVYPEELQNKLLADVTIQNLDSIDQENIQTLDSTEDYAYIEHLFRYLLKSWIAPYGFVRSESIMKTAIYSWFEKAGDGRDKIDEIQRILVCSKEKQRIFCLLYTCRCV